VVPPVVLPPPVVPPMFVAVVPPPPAAFGGVAPVVPRFAGLPTGGAEADGDVAPGSAVAPNASPPRA
jgi:hypothetical protein